MTAMRSAPRSVLSLFSRFRRDERGATAIEYALIAVSIAAAVAATVFSTGSSLNANFYAKVDNAFKQP